MKSYIEKIFLNEHTNCENLTQSKKYWEIHSEICEYIDKLNAELNDGQKKILFDLDLAQGGLCSETENSAFKAGFILGLRVGLEAAEENDGN